MLFSCTNSYLHFIFLCVWNLFISISYAHESVPDNHFNITYSIIFIVINRIWWQHFFYVHLMLESFKKNLFLNFFSSLIWGIYRCGTKKHFQNVDYVKRLHSHKKNYCNSVCSNRNVFLSVQSKTAQTSLFKVYRNFSSIIVSGKIQLKGIYAFKRNHSQSCLRKCEILHYVRAGRW